MLPFAAAAGSFATAAANIWNANKQAKSQRQFAQHGLSWRVADAKRSGIHPLAALGFQGTQYSPQSLGIGDSLKDAGQAVDNALHRATDQHSRTMASLAEERAVLENAHLKDQIISHRANRTGTPPALRRSGDPLQPPPPPEHYGLLLGSPQQTNPHFSDAQKFTDRYGESADYLEGMANRFADFQYRDTGGLPIADHLRLLAMRFRHGTDRGRSYRHR